MPKKIEPAKKLPPKFPPCKYAYDPEDEVCSQCNGIQFVESTKTYDATSCKGYEPLEEVEFQEEEKTTLPVIDFKKIQKELEEPPAEPETLPPSEETVHPQPVNQSNDSVQSPSNLPPLVPFEIHAESAITIQAKSGNGLDQWYKVVYGESRRVPEGYDVEVAKADLWDTVNGEVDNQATEIIALLKG